MAPRPRRPGLGGILGNSGRLCHRPLPRPRQGAGAGFRVFTEEADTGPRGALSARPGVQSAFTPFGEPLSSPQGLRAPGRPGVRLGTGSAAPICRALPGPSETGLGTAIGLATEGRSLRAAATAGAGVPPAALRRVPGRPSGRARSARPPGGGGGVRRGRAGSFRRGRGAGRGGGGPGQQRPQPSGVQAPPPRAAVPAGPSPSWPWPCRWLWRRRRLRARRGQRAPLALAVSGSPRWDPEARRRLAVPGPPPPRRQPRATADSGQPSGRRAMAR